MSGTIEPWRALYAQTVDGWLPTGEMRWIIRKEAVPIGSSSFSRHETVRVLQQRWRTIDEPERIRTEWRDVPEVECQAPEAART